VLCFNVSLLHLLLWCSCLKTKRFKGLHCCPADRTSFTQNFSLCHTAMEAAAYLTTCTNIRHKPPKLTNHSSCFLSITNILRVPRWTERVSTRQPVFAVIVHSMSDLELALLTPSDLLQLCFQLFQASNTHLQHTRGSDTSQMCPFHSYHHRLVVSCIHTLSSTTLNLQHQGKVCDWKSAQLLLKDVVCCMDLCCMDLCCMMELNVPSAAAGGLTCVLCTISLLVPKRSSITDRTCWTSNSSCCRMRSICRENCSTQRSEVSRRRSPPQRWDADKSHAYITAESCFLELELLFCQLLPVQSQRNTHQTRFN